MSNSMPYFDCEASDTNKHKQTTIKKLLWPIQSYSGSLHLTLILPVHSPGNRHIKTSIVWPLLLPPTE